MALTHSRISRVFYGVPNDEFGGLGGLYSVHTEPKVNHRYLAFAGLLQDKCSALLAARDGRVASVDL
jgi:tRNA(Arg) A34 adenosine deaminase TadA